jgi:hypothetical protein
VALGLSESKIVLALAIQNDKASRFLPLVTPAPFPKIMLRYLRRRFVLFTLAVVTWFGVRKAPVSRYSVPGTFPTHGNGRPVSYANASMKNQNTLSIVTVCDLDVLLAIERTLMPLVVSEILLCCEEDRVSSFQAIKSRISSNFEPFIHIVGQLKDVPIEVTLLHTVSRIHSDYALILDPASGNEMPSFKWISETLSKSHKLDSTVGPAGHQVFFSADCPRHDIRCFQHVRPPLVVSKRLVAQALSGLSVELPVWSAFSGRIADMQRLNHESIEIVNKHSLESHKLLENSTKSRVDEISLFISILPDLGSLEAFGSTLCRIALNGHRLLLITLGSSVGQTEGLIIGNLCYLPYLTFGTLQEAMEQFEPFISYVAPSLVVIFYVEESATLSKVITTLKQIPESIEVVAVAFTPEDMMHSNWISTIEPEEWRGMDITCLEYIYFIPISLESNESRLFCHN